MTKNTDKRIIDKSFHTGHEVEYVAIQKSDYEYLKEQAERAQELEEERSEWKGKYSILKNKYRALQRKAKNRWRYNRALENESRTNEIVLEEFREENKRYREALEKIKLNVKICGNEEYFPKLVEEIVNEALECEE